MQRKTRFTHKFSSVEVRDLRLNARLNRAVRPARVKWFARNMDLDKLGPFVVWRDGRDLWVIDGQHRKLALEEIGFGELPVDCEVISGASFEAACDIFLARNDGLAVRPYDKFDKGVKAGYEDCVATKQIIESFGLAVSEQSGSGRICAVGAARDTFNLDRGESLTAALAIITTAWGTGAEALDGQIIRGLGHFAHTYNGSVDRAALVRKLSKLTPYRVLGQARDSRVLKGGAVSRNIATLAVDIYNKGRSSGKLPPL